PPRPNAGSIAAGSRPGLRLRLRLGPGRRTGPDGSGIVVVFVAGRAGTGGGADTDKALKCRNDGKGGTENRRDEEQAKRRDFVEYRLGAGQRPEPEEYGHHGENRQGDFGN